VSLQQAWAGQAEDWSRWARAAGHDSYWLFHRDRFLELLPPPGRLTLDLGCGEGRLPRDLGERGYRVVGLDVTPALVDLAREADPGGEYVLGDAAALPFEDASFDLVLAFMSLMDMDDPARAILEAARVLVRGGRFCVALEHPINSAGAFVAREPGSPFVIEGSYLEPHRYANAVEKDGLQMTFTGDHRPLEGWFGMLECAGFAVERVREIEDGSSRRWSRVPLFLHLRAVKR